MKNIVICTIVFGLSVGCAKKESAAPSTTIEVSSAQTVPESPTDPAWTKAPEHIAKLLLQDIVEPRLLASSTEEVRVRALAAGKELAFRLEWSDKVKNDISADARFSDACAVQMPERSEPDVPAPQMGEKGKPVQVAYWNASWQALVDGRENSPQAIYPNMAVDHYPFEAAPLAKDPALQQAMATRYAPARAAHNPMAGPHTVPVQDLIAEGPGTLTPAADVVSRGKGEWTERGWSVVIVRPLPKEFVGNGRSQAAFAVWEGAKQEVGSRKMRTGWIPITLKAAQ